MHSSMYQLSEGVEEKIEEEEIYGFVGTIADYMIEVEDKTEDIKWLLSSFPKGLFVYNDLEKSIEFKEGFKEEFFRAKYEDFKKNTENLTLEEFSGADNKFNIGPNSLYLIEHLLDNKYGFYIYCDDYYQTLDNFVRYSSLLEKKFYIGTIFNYKI